MKLLTPYIRISYYDRLSGDWKNIEEAATSFSHSQALGNSITQFSITLKGNHRAMKNITLRHNGMFRVWLSNDGRLFHPIIYPGFVSRINEVKRFSPGGYSFDYQVSGLDIGKFLIKHSVTTNLAIQRGIDAVLDAHNFPSAPDNKMAPGDLIKMILNNRFFVGVGTSQEPVDLIFPDGSMPQDILDIESYFEDTNENSDYKAEMVNVGSWIYSEGTVLNLIHQYSDPLFNELFIRPVYDPLNDETKTVLVFRRKPFYCSEFSNAWTELQLKHGIYEFSIDNGIVETSTLGTSDDAVYTYWLISSQIEGINNDSVKSAFDTERNIRNMKVRVPILDREWLKDYGFSQFVQSSPFVPIFNLNHVDEAVDVIAMATLRIWEYNCLQPEMKDGSIVIKGGAPGVYIGTAAINTDDNREYYVQGVSHNWSPGTMKTTLNLTRGISQQRLKDRLAEKMGKMK